MELATIDDFFPGIADSTFVERATGATVPLRFLWRADADRRHLEIVAPAGHKFRAFFDRLTITSSTLEFERFRAGALSLTLQPPLVVTLGAETNRAGNLFGGGGLDVPMAIGPYEALATKELIDARNHPLMWRVTITVCASNGVVASSTTYTFARGIGLIECRGQFFGVFFIYQRVGVPAPPMLVRAAGLLALDRTREAKYRKRDGTEEQTLAWTATAPTTFTYGGTLAVVPAVLTSGDAGVRASRVRIWNQVVAADPPAPIADARLDLSREPSFASEVPQAEGISTPSRGRVKSVHLTATWSFAPASAPGMEKGGGEFATDFLPHAFLTFEVMARASDGAAIPGYRQVLALREGAGPVRIGIFNAGAPPVIWDLSQHS